MWPFKSRRRTPEKAWHRRQGEVEDRLDALEARVDARYAELKSLRGLVHNIKVAATAPEEAQEPENGNQGPQESYPDTSVPMLQRRRIRGF